MSKSKAQSYTGIPAEFQCVDYGEIAQTQGLSTPPTGWKRRLDLGAFPGRCVAWTCANCTTAAIERDLEAGAADYAAELGDDQGGD